MRPIEIIDFNQLPVKAATPPFVFEPDKVWEAEWPTDMVEKSGQVEIYYQRAMKNDRTINLCRALSVTTEIHYARMASYFRATNRPKMKLVVASLSKNHDGMGGGYHHEASGTTLFADVKFDKKANRYDPAFTSFIFVAEAIQPMAYFNSIGFSDYYDQGEALSRVMAITIMPGQLGPYGVIVKWLNSKKRENWLEKLSTAYAGPAIGSCMAWLMWMHNKQHISWEAILAGGKNMEDRTVEEIYHKITGRSGAYASMMVDINKAYPPGVLLEDNEANETIFV